MNPWPMAWFTTSGGKKVKVTECRAVPSHGEAPGTVLATRPLTLACAEGAIQLLHVVPEGKKPTDKRASTCGGSAAQSGGLPVSGPNPRAAVVGPGEAGAGRLFQPRPGCRTEDVQQLEGRDKAFASAIFYTVLEHRGTLDYMLGQFLPKGLARLDAPVRGILSLRSGPGPVYAGARIGGRQ